jgi:arylsulfatase A-like enzyme
MLFEQFLTPTLERFLPFYVKIEQHYIRADGIAKKGLEWIDTIRDRKRPFFLMLHFMDPHDPYMRGQLEGRGYVHHRLKSYSREEFVDKLIDAYVGDIDFMDTHIGAFLDGIRHRGLYEDALIVLTSDHGEEFKDHGSMGHKTTVYAEQLHVPLIIVYPPRITAGQRISSQASLVDIYPTLAGLVGEEVPAQTQGTDLGVFWTDAAKPEQDRADPRHAPESGPLFAELGPLGRPWEGTPPKRAIRTEKYRLIWNQNRDVKELFDISVDPREQRDLYASMRSSPKVRRLERQLKAFIEAGAAYKPGAPDQNKIEIDRKTQEQLRALGYAD